MSTAAAPAPLTTEDMERIMKEIELNDGPAVPANNMQPNAVPNPQPAANTAPAGATLPPAGNPLNLREFVDAEQLKRDVEFNVANLDEAVQSHASLFVHYANNARLARRQHDRMKAACDILESRLDSYHREVLKAAGKATENQIAAAVKADPRWWAAQQRLIDAKAIYDLANDAKEAFAQRRDMIVQISVDRREERKGELRIKAVDDGRALALAAEAASRQQR